MNLGKLIIDIDGPELTQEDKDILKHPNIGGVILFSRNYISIYTILVMGPWRLGNLANCFLLAFCVLCGCY